MGVADRIEAALAADECAGVATLLAALVYSLRAEGMSKKAIAVAYYDTFRRLQADGRHAEADAVGEILDVLAGECKPEARLLPDEPDVKL